LLAFDFKGKAVTEKGIISIVENDAVRLEDLQKILEKYNYIVARVVANEGSFSTIVDTNPDLVLLSAHITEIDLYELLDKLKSDKRTIDLPIIFTTTPEDVETREK
jgi:PleD family two-component response regulator